MRFRSAAAGFALSMGLASCATGAGAPGSLNVVVSVAPMAEAVARVGADRVTVVDLAPPGAEPHDLELTPRDLEVVARADLVLYLGGGFQPSVDDAARSAGNAAVDLLAELDAPDPGERAGDEHAAGDHADPHVWLDPVLMSDLVAAVERALARADPAGAGEFSRNARAYRDELAGLDRAYRDGLAACERRVIVTSHAAFGSLAERYDLMQEPIAGLAPEAEPDPQRLAALTGVVRRTGVTTIFTEALASPRVAQALARETGTRTAVLDPIESIPPEQRAAGETYLTLMRRNLETLREALGCR